VCGSAWRCSRSCRLEDEDGHPVADGLGVDLAQGLLVAGLGEQAGPAAEDDGEHHQPQLVDEILLVAVLVEDATFAMPPDANWWRGRDAVVGFIAGSGKLDLRGVTAGANGQPAIGWYGWESSRSAYVPAALEVLDIEGARVRQITAFASPQLYPRFGLPAEVRRAL
jgi:hypothetical protein